MTFTIDFEPTGTRLVCAEPILLLDAATRAGVPLRAVCGGKATCGKCLVRVSAGNVSPVTDAERLLLSDAEIAAGYRQACRALASGDVSVYIPPASLLEEQKLQVEGVETALEVDPSVRKYLARVPPASLADPRGDLERTAAALQEQHAIVLTRADPPTLTQLSAALRHPSPIGEGEWTITATVRGDELIAAEVGDTTSCAVGLAVDLGTTKIACYLVDLMTGRTLAARGVMNPQIRYGEDVIARIEAAVRSDAARDALCEMVHTAINDVAADLCQSVGIAPSQILEMTIVGNTAMHHLALGLPVQQLGVIPFVPVIAQPLDVKCAMLGLRAAPGAYVHFPPLIAGFVGSDHVAALVASHAGQVARAASPPQSSRPLDARLTIDLGTNTEVALEARGRVVSCSTACGPAFEGAHIQFGMRAAPGAIERVKIDANGAVQITTIGNKPAVGICGSGILDAAAELLRVGWMNAQGRLNAASPCVRSADNGVKEFVLTRATPAGGREVVLTQKDLGEIQLAKGAIRAGIDILMEQMNVRAEEIDEVIVAGAFGAYLDPANAVRIGLFPRVPLARIHQVGNAAGVGAKQMLVSRRRRVEAARVAQEVDYLELTLHPQFTQRFAEGMRYQ